MDRKHIQTRDQSMMILLLAKEGKIKGVADQHRRSL